MLKDGESVPIISIGNDTGNSVVCDTNNTNRNCCRKAESGTGAIGNWYLPDGSAVITRANLEQLTDTLYRVVAAQQVRLESKGYPVGPLGIYTCSVPDISGMLVNATINITNEVSGKLYFNFFLILSTTHANNSYYVINLLLIKLKYILY